MGTTDREAVKHTASACIAAKLKLKRSWLQKTLKSQRAAAQSIMGISPFPSLPLWLQVLLTEATPRLPSTSNPPTPRPPQGTGCLANGEAKLGGEVWV